MTAKFLTYQGTDIKTMSSEKQSKYRHTQKKKRRKVLLLWVARLHLENHQQIATSEPNPLAKAWVVQSAIIFHDQSM